MKKLVYLIHPVSPVQVSHEDNLISLAAIIKKINLTMPDVVPFAPYFCDLATSPSILSIKFNVPVINMINKI